MKKIILLLSVLSVMASCTTYYMTTRELQGELSKINETTITYVYNFKPGILISIIKGRQFNNGLSQIECTDKNGKKLTLGTSKNTQVRLTFKDGTRKVLYFDTMFVKDSLVYGKQSRYFDMPVNTTYNNIVKVEIQSPDGKVSYKK
jgi:hypothetical protein